MEEWIAVAADQRYCSQIQVVAEAFAEAFTEITTDIAADIAAEITTKNISRTELNLNYSSGDP